MKAAAGCIDRETGEPVSADPLLSYHEALAQYHQHPESKFHNGDYTDRGFTRRRRVRAAITEFIGKEANRWEERFHLGLDLKAQTEYGISPEDTERMLDCLRVACERLGQRAVAKAVRMSLRDVSGLLHGKRTPTSVPRR
jgi:truncated hemoglobin YjbI